MFPLRLILILKSIFYSDLVAFLKFDEFYQFLFSCYCADKLCTFSINVPFGSTAFSLLLLLLLSLLFPVSLSVSVSTLLLVSSSVLSSQLLLVLLSGLAMAMELFWPPLYAADTHLFPWHDSSGKSNDGRDNRVDLLARTLALLTRRSDWRLHISSRMRT